VTAIRCDVDGPVTVLTLHAPARCNALSQAMLKELRERLTAPAPDTRAVVLAGAGGNFSAGADLREISGSVADLDIDRGIGDTAAVIRSTPFPVIAAIEGACVGAGVEIALACDARIAAYDAFFELPATRLGLLYRPAAIAEMLKVARPESLTRLVLLGERLGASQALSAGLVGALAPHGHVVDTALELATASCRGEPDAVAATKALLHSVWLGSFDAAEWEGRRRELLTSPARREALAATRARLGMTGDEGSVP
jgi:enoyl-CoA hydratase/carnithine racemase